MKNVPWPFDEHRVLADKQRMRNFVTECALQRKQGVSICHQRVLSNLCAFGRPLTRPRLKDFVFDDTDLYAPTGKGMRVKAVPAIAALINSAGKRLLERLKLGDA